MTRYQQDCSVEEMQMYDSFLLALAAEGVERFPIRGKKTHEAFAETLTRLGMEPQIDVVSGIPDGLDEMIIEGMEALLLQTDNNYGYLRLKQEDAKRELNSTTSEPQKYLDMVRTFRQRIS